MRPNTSPNWTTPSGPSGVSTWLRTLATCTGATSFIFVNPAGVNRWYRNLVEANGGLEATQRFARFFNVPGLGHCSGGAAMDVFDPVTAIYDWVEKGMAPQLLPARSTEFPNRVRNLCPWPQIARYVGSGSVDDAASFRCVAP